MLMDSHLQYDSILFHAQPTKYLSFQLYYRSLASITMQET
jgi:hypothetical protein